MNSPVTTSCTKSIWIVILKDNGDIKTRTRRVAAWNLSEVLAYFNEEGQKNIIEIRKSDEEITYHY